MEGIERRSFNAWEEVDGPASTKLAQNRLVRRASGFGVAGEPTSLSRMEKSRHRSAEAGAGKLTVQDGFNALHEKEKVDEKRMMMKRRLVRRPVTSNPLVEDVTFEDEEEDELMWVSGSVTNAANSSYLSGWQNSPKEGEGNQALDPSEVSAPERKLSARDSAGKSTKTPRAGNRPLPRRNEASGLRPVEFEPVTKLADELNSEAQPERLKGAIERDCLLNLLDAEQISSSRFGSDPSGQLDAKALDQDCSMDLGPLNSDSKNDSAEDTPSTMKKRGSVVRGLKLFRRRGLSN